MVVVYMLSFRMTTIYATRCQITDKKNIFSEKCCWFKKESINLQPLLKKSALGIEKVAVSQDSNRLYTVKKSYKKSRIICGDR